MDTDIEEREHEERDEFLVKKASAIRKLTKSVACDVIEIGQHLAEANARCNHGEWQAWLNREFAWGYDTALRLMRVYNLVKYRKLRDFESLGLSTLYLLSEQKTPEAVRVEVATRVQAGDVPTFGQVRGMVAECRSRVEPTILELPPDSSTRESRRTLGNAMEGLHEIRAKVAGIRENLDKGLDVSSAVKALILFGRFAKNLDVDTLRVYLEDEGCKEEFLDAVSAAVSLRRALEPKREIPDHLRLVEKDADLQK